MTTRSSRRFSIAANTPKLDVDNRFPLKKYYRTADNLLKQAYIYREEKNILELYVLLLRFSSLVGETIPEHQDYHTSSGKQRAVYYQKCKQVLSELELLKPEVQKRVEELNSSIVNIGGPPLSNRPVVQSVNKYEWPPISNGPVVQSVNNENTNWQLQVSQNFQIRPYQVDEQLMNLSWKLPPPKQETLSRHSFLGPNGLRAPWDMPISQARVQYPSYIDVTPIEVPSLNQSENKTVSVIEAPLSAASLDFEVETPSQSVSGGEQLDIISQLSVLMQPSPPPVPVPVQSMPIMPESLELSKQENSSATVSDLCQGPLSALADDVKQTGDPKSLHISTKMMEEFLKLARSNTNNNIETCAVLAGSFKNATFYVTALIVPKQQATSDTCQTVNEEEIFEWQDKRGLFQLGWIHTHPTQSCFMSSVDLHTHYSYQVMLPEAIAIVMAPRDDRRKYGIFRLSDPTGVKAIQKCPLRGFHAHDQPSDGNPIYEQCSHVFLSSTLKYQVADLR